MFHFKGDFFLQIFVCGNSDGSKIALEQYLDVHRSDIVSDTTTSDSPKHKSGGVAKVQGVLRCQIWHFIMETL